MDSQLEQKLETLIITKSFTELSISEKKYVLSQISEVDFNIYHDFLKDTTTVFNQEEKNINLSENIKIELSEVFKRKYKSQFLKPLKISYINFSIPYYQPIFATLIIFIAIYFIYPTKVNNQNFALIPIKTTEPSTNLIQKNEEITTYDSTSIKILEENINPKFSKKTLSLNKKNESYFEELTDEIFIKNTQFADLEISNIANVTNQLATMDFSNDELNTTY